MIDLAKMKAEIKRDEGFRSKPYKDTVGKATVGYGRNLDDVGITEAEADFLLTGDIARAITDLDMAFPYWQNLSDIRQRAILNMCFNMGIHRLLEFRKMFAALRNNDFKSAYDEALESKWAKQVGSRADRIAYQLLTGE
jgi:lysozyme